MSNSKRSFNKYFNKDNCHAKINLVTIQSRLNSVDIPRKLQGDVLDGWTAYLKLKLVTSQNLKENITLLGESRNAPSMP